MATISHLLLDRKSKLLKLKELGINPYPSKAVKRVFISIARKLDKTVAVIAGRIVAKRGHGGLVFMDLADTSGKIQIAFKKNQLENQKFQLVSLLDTGDFISVTGVVGTSASGEITVFASDLTLLTKSLRSLPDQWYGLKDIEARYRQRYVDLLVNDAVRLVFLTRSRVISYLRNALDRDGFLEVETPVLQPIYGGASAKPFTTHHQTLDVDLFLRISDELYLKRLIVGGFEKVYEIGKDFRNEGMDREHNPEFTMCEFYWAYADYEILMDYTQILLSEMVKKIKGSYQLTYQGTKLDFTPPWPRKTYRELMLEFTGIDIDKFDDDVSLKKEVTKRKLKVDVSKVIGYGAIVDEIYKSLVRPFLTGPMFVTERPTEFVTLAKRLENNPKKTGSFQLLVCGKEIINAYNELNDPVDQAQRWKDSERLGKKGKTEHEAFDFDYIRALEYGMPPTSGWGMGIDRFVLILTDQHTIKDVILFPTLRPETSIEK